MKTLQKDSPTQWLQSWEQVTCTRGVLVIALSFLGCATAQDSASAEAVAVLVKAMRVDESGKMGLELEAMANLQRERDPSKIDQYRDFIECLRRSDTSPFRELYVEALRATMTSAEVIEATRFFKSEVGKAATAVSISAMYKDQGLTPPVGPVELTEDQHAEYLRYRESSSGAKLILNPVLSGSSIRDRILHLTIELQRSCTPEAIQ